MCRSKCIKFILFYFIIIILFFLIIIIIVLYGVFCNIGVNSVFFIMH